MHVCVGRGYSTSPRVASDQGHQMAVEDKLKK